MQEKDPKDILNALPDDERKATLLRAANNATFEDYLKSNPDAVKALPAVAAGIFGKEANEDEIVKVVQALKLFAYFELFYDDNKKLQDFAATVDAPDKERKAMIMTGFFLYVTRSLDLDKMEHLLANTDEFERLVDLAYKIKEEENIDTEIAWSVALALFQRKEDKEQRKLEIVRHATHRKVLTGIIPRKFLTYANADGDGEVNGNVRIKEKTMVVIPLDFNSDAVDVSGRRLTPYDKQVHDAVCTLWGNGITHFTAEEVYRAMNRISDNSPLGNVNLEKINQSLEAAVLRRVRIDATEQFKARKVNDIKSAIFEDYFLPLRRIDITNRVGRTVIGWQMSGAPALYSYGEALKQIATIPMALLDTRKQVKNSEIVSRISDTLISRIEWLKGRSKKAADVILYKTLFEECEIDYDRLNKTLRMRKRAQAKDILKGFKRNGYIKDFHEVMEARIPKGIRIEINKEVKEVNKQ